MTLQDLVDNVTSSVEPAVQQAWGVIALVVVFMMMFSKKTRAFILPTVGLLLFFGLLTDTDTWDKLKGIVEGIFLG